MRLHRSVWRQQARDESVHQSGRGCLVGPRDLQPRGLRQAREYVRPRAAVGGIVVLIEQPHAQGPIKFRIRSFRCRPDAQAALSDVSPVISPGATIALVAAPGRRKTTLVSLTPRLLHPTEGRIPLDRENLRCLTLASARFLGARSRASRVFSAASRPAPGRSPRSSRCCRARPPRSRWPTPLTPGSGRSSPWRSWR